jgi:hypothetical protein
MIRIAITEAADLCQRTTGGTMPTPTRDLRALVGKKVRIERDGVTHEGFLMGELYRHVRGSKIAHKRWVLFVETLFKANDGWTVTPLPLARKRASSKAQHDGLP